MSTVNNTSIKTNLISFGGILQKSKLNKGLCVFSCSYNSGFTKIFSSRFSGFLAICLLVGERQMATQTSVLRWVWRLSPSKS
ncbi:hypothetical protein HORM4_150003 [Vibrio harveyi]|nr:hypothetical protein HORM4_150003 [Vibrio harveyi]